MNNTLDRWFESTFSGGYLLNKEIEFLNSISAQLHGKTTIHLGSSAVFQRIMTPKIGELSYFGRNEFVQIKCDELYLPLQDESVDIIIMAHAFELSEHPKRLLQEVNRVLKAGGELLIFGFNPYSLFNLNFQWNQKKLPKRRYCISLKRMKDWLDLLFYHIEQGQFMVYIPMLQNKQFAKRFDFLEKAGNRWWPERSAVYGLLARKQVIPLTPILSKIKQIDNSINDNILVPAKVKSTSN